MTIIQAMKALGIAVAALLLVLCAAWSVRWQYQGAEVNGHTVKIRVHRFSGETQQLTRYGWLEMTRRTHSARPARAISTAPPATPPARSPEECVRAHVARRTELAVANAICGRPRDARMPPDDLFSDISDRYLNQRPGS